MDEMDQNAKQKVLEQIMSMMDDKMTGDLKSQSPKFGMAEISKVGGGDDEGSPMEAMETPGMEANEDISSSDDSSDMSEDDKAKLKELYEKYC